MEVPVKLQGFAEGVQAGGKLSLVVRKLKVKAIPANLPGEIVLDVTNLGLGKSIKVKDLSFENFEIVNAKEVVVAQIKDVYKRQLYDDAKNRGRLPVRG